MNRAAMLEGPIARNILALAGPVFAVLALQTFVGVAETYFVSSLGTAAIAGVSLVVPLSMLMVMMSNGGIGGGVSAAVARAFGGGRRHDANALVLHAIAIAVAFGALFSLGAWLWGPALFTRMGASGETLANAVVYSNLVFLAAIPAWIANLLGSALRGAGNVRVPAIVTAAGAVVTLALSPLLIFGWGFVPRLGVAGAGVAMIVFNVAAMVVLAMYMRSAASPLRLSGARFEARLFADILRVGLPSALGTIVANLTVVVTTGLVGAYGRDAIAGYGIASRLDYLLIPLLFALGTASVTMVGMNIGAGRRPRARRIAWTGAALSSALTGAIGLAVAIAPSAWMRLFSGEAPVIAAGSDYLARVGPMYAFLGAGMALYFASQGAGRMAWPFGAGVVRLGLVAGVGAFAAHSLDALYWTVAASYVAFGAINLFAMATGLSWGMERRPAAERAVETVTP
jgi:putative MATE family efflux protein